MTLKEISKMIDNGNNIVVRCDTQEKATKFLIMCRDKGFKFADGKEICYESITDTWLVYESDTMYCIRSKNPCSIMYGPWETTHEDIYYKKGKPTIAIVLCEYLYVEYEDETDVIEKSDMTLESLMNITN